MPKLGYLDIAVDHRPLHLDRAADRIDDAGKFYQQAVAGGLDNPTTKMAARRRVLVILT